MFADVAILRLGRATLALDGGAVDVVAGFVNDGLFRVYSLHAVAGRTITATEAERVDTTPVAVLNHAFWMQQFGGDLSILNRTIRLNQIPVTVVGVLGPPGFSASPRVPQVFLPLATCDQFGPPGRRVTIPWNSPGMGVHMVVASLRAGIDRTQAERALRARYQVLLEDAVAQGARLTDAVRQMYATEPPTLVPAGTAASAGSTVRRTLDPPLRLLLGMTILVLLVAAGNVANLLLARGAARQHEMAVSYALGAQRWHLLRPLLVESLLLGLGAAAAGLLLAVWVGHILPTLLGLDSDLAGISTAPDRRVVVFTLSISMGAALLIWLASAFAVTRRFRASLAPAMPRAEGGKPALVLRRSLVIVQVALSIALLCTAALFARSLVHVLSVDPGFDTGNLMAFSVNPDGAGYEGERRQAFIDRLVEEVVSVPGVTHAASTSMLPLTGGLSGTHIEGPRQAAGHTTPAR